MAVLEVETFSLKNGFDDSAFRALDEQMQEWCYLNRPGLARRTTARGDDGAYIVITLFGDASQAGGDFRSSDNPVVVEWCSAIIPGTTKVSVYSLL